MSGYGFLSGAMGIGHTNGSTNTSRRVTAMPRLNSLALSQFVAVPSAMLLATRGRHNTSGGIETRGNMAWLLTIYDMVGRCLAE